MSLAFVQATNGGGDGSSATATTGSSTSVTGNCILVFVRSSSNTPPTSVTDTALNTYQLIGSNRIADNENVLVFVARNITGNVANVVVVTWSGAQSFSYCIALEFSGADSDVPVDILTTSIGIGGSTTHTSHKFSTSSADAILVSGTQISATGTTWTAGSGFTIPSGGESASTVLATQYKIVSALQVNQDVSITNSGTSRMGTIVVALRAPIPAGGGGGGLMCNVGMQGGMRG